MSTCKRGWRLTAPNLEQCGLLEVDYQSLQRPMRNRRLLGRRGDASGAGRCVSAEERYNVTKALLDWMRRELASLRDKS